MDLHGQMDLHGRNLLKEIDFTPEEFLYLVDLGGGCALRSVPGHRAASAGRPQHRADLREGLHPDPVGLRGGRVRRGRARHLPRAGGVQIGYKESMKDTARVLGRMYDGIEYRGFAQESVEILGAFAGVPVWNGLTDEWHPTQMLADMLTVRDHPAKPLTGVSWCYLGDARNNTANSLLVTGALLGMDTRICAPAQLQPSAEVQRIARGLAARSGAALTVTEDVKAAVAGADFLYTDVWLSMGEPPGEWDKRIDLLLDYQVNAGVLAATGNPAVKFMHCLPALHNRDTRVGEEIYQRRGLTALEVTEEVFESPASVVFDQAENRMHTIKAVMVATLGRQP